MSNTYSPANPDAARRFVDAGIYLETEGGRRELEEQGYRISTDNQFIKTPDGDVISAQDLKWAGEELYEEQQAQYIAEDEEGYYEEGPRKDWSKINRPGYEAREAGKRIDERQKTLAEANKYGLRGSDLDPLSPNYLYGTSRHYNVDPFEGPAHKSRMVHQQGVYERALTRSKYSAAQGVMGLAHMAARGAGSEDGQEWTAKKIAEYDNEIQGHPAVVPSYTDIDSIGDAGTYVAEKVIENVTMLGMGGVGGLAARVVGRGAAKQATKQAMLKARRQAVPDALRAERIRAAQPALTPSKAAEVTRQKLWDVGKTKSNEVLNKYTKAGATAGFYPANAGETEISQMNLENPASPAIVAAAGAVKSALDVIGVERALTSFFGAKQATNIQEMAKEVIKAAGVSGASEGVTETLQTAVDIVLRGIQDPSFDPLGPESIQAFKESAVGGAAVGLSLGAVSGGIGSLGGEPGPGTAPPKPTDEPPAPAPSGDGGPDLDFRHNLLASVVADIKSNNSAAAREAHDTLRSVDAIIATDLDKWFDTSGDDIKWKPGGKQAYEDYLRNAKGSSGDDKGDGPEYPTDDGGGSGDNKGDGPEYPTDDGGGPGDFQTPNEQSEGTPGDMGPTPPDFTGSGEEEQTPMPKDAASYETLIKDSKKYFKEFKKIDLKAESRDEINARLDRKYKTLEHAKELIASSDFTGSKEEKKARQKYGVELKKNVQAEIDLLKKSLTVEAVNKLRGASAPPENEEPKPVNVHYTAGDNKILSNLASRPFEHGGQRFQSVEHAYQSLKSGKLDEPTYRKTWVDGTKIRGTGSPDRKTNRALMKALMKESFDSNPEAKAKLLATGESPLTHKPKGIGTNDYWATEFPKILTELRSEYGGIAQDKQAPKDTGDYSKTVKKLQGVADEWFGRMGLEGPTIVSDPGLTSGGQHYPGARQIRLATSELRKIQSKDSTPLERAQAMDVFAHESGHALSSALGLLGDHNLHDKGQWRKRPKNALYTTEELNSLKVDFNQWKTDADKGKEATKYDGRRSPIGQTRSDAALENDPSKTKMEEWFADQVGHYLLTGKYGLDLSSKSKGVIKRIADSIKEFYTKLMKELGVADKEVAPSVVAVIERQFAKPKAKPKATAKPKAKQSVEYPPVTTGHNSITTIISGGQTGGDIAGIRAGQQLKREGWGIELGGMVPKGYVAEDGGIAKADRPVFTEDGSSAYPPRTKKNVQNADATIAFTRKGSVGTGKTIKMAKEQGKPHHAVDLKELVAAYKKKGKKWGKHVAGFAEFLATNENVHSLNVAGIRGSHASTVGAVNRAELEKIIQEFLVEGIKQGEKKPSKTTSKAKVKATTGKSQSYIDAVDRAVNFLNHYGFEVRYAEKLLIDLAHKEIDADLSDPVQLAKALADPLASMLSYSSEFNDLHQALRGSEEYKAKVAKLREKYDADDVRAEGKAKREATKLIFREILEGGISDKLTSDYNLNVTLKAKLLKFLDDVKAFLKGFADSKDWKEVKEQVQGIVDRTFEGDDFDFIRATEKPDYHRVDLQEAFEGDKLAHSIMSRIGPHPKVILTGSIAYAPQGAIYRPKGSEVHDLDFIFEGTDDESDALVKGHFDGAELVYDFAEAGKSTRTYIVPPKGHTIKGIERRTTSRSKVMGFKVMKGDKVVGTWSADPKTLAETKTGVQGVFVDFFHDIINPRTIDFDFKTDDGKIKHVNLSHFGRGFEAKLAFGRLKDIWDYNRFTPTRSEVDDGQVEGDILNATQTQEHEGAGFDDDGERISGDTDSTQVDPRRVTFRVQGEGSTTNWEEFKEGEPITLKRAGFKSIKTNQTLINQATTIAKVVYGTSELVFIRRMKGVIGEYIDITESVENGTLGAEDSRPILIVPKTPLGEAPRYTYKGENKTRTMADRFASIRYDQFMELSQQVTIEKVMHSDTDASWVVAHRNDTRDAELNASKLLKRFELMKEAGRGYKKNRVMLDKVVNGKHSSSVAFDGYKIMRLGLDLNGVTGAASVSDKKEGLLTGLTVLRNTDVGGSHEHVVYDLPVGYRDEAPDPSKRRTQRVEFVDQWVKVDGISLPSLGGSSRPVAQLTVKEEAELLIQLDAVDMSNTQNLLQTGGKEKRLVEGKKKKVREPKRLVTEPASGIATSDTEEADKHLARAEALTRVKDRIKLLVNKSPKNKDAGKARKKLLSLANKEGDLAEAVRKYLGVDGNEYTDLAVSKFVTALETGKTEDAIKGVVIPYWLPRLIAREASKARARGKLILKGIDLDGPFSEAEELAIELLEDQIERTNDAWEVKELEDKLSLFMMHREKADYETITEGGTNKAEVDPRMTSANPPLKNVERDPTVQQISKFGPEAENAKIKKKTVKTLSKTHSYTADKRATKLVDTWKKLLGIKTQVVMADMEGVQRYIKELGEEKTRLTKLQKIRDQRRSVLDKKNRTEEEHTEWVGLQRKVVTAAELKEFDDAIKELNGIVIDGALNNGISSSRIIYMDKYKHSKLRVPVIYVPSVKQLKAENKAKRKELKAQGKHIASRLNGMKPGDKAKATKNLQDLNASIKELKAGSLDLDIVKALAHEFGHLVQRTSLDQLVQRNDKGSQEILKEIFGEVDWNDDKEARAARERFADMFIHWVDGRPVASDAVTKFFKGILDKLKALVRSLKSIVTTVGEKARAEWGAELNELEVRRDQIVRESFSNTRLRAGKKKRADAREKLKRVIRRHDEDISALQGILSHIWKIAGVNEDTLIGIGNPKLTKTFSRLSPDYIPVGPADSKHTKVPERRVILDPNWWEGVDQPTEVGAKGEFPGSSVYKWLEAGKPLEGSTKVSRGESRFVQGYSVGAVAERLAAELDSRDRYKGQLGLMNHDEGMLESELNGIRERIKELKAQLEVKPKTMDHQPSFDAFLNAMVDRHIAEYPDKYVEAARSLSTSTTMHRRGAVSGVKSADKDFFIGERVVSSARDSRVGKATKEQVEKLTDKMSMFDPLYKSVDRVLRAMGSPTATSIAKNFRVQGHEAGVPTIPEIIKGYQQRLYLDMRVHEGGKTFKVGMIDTLAKLPDMPTWFDKKRNPDKARKDESKLKAISRHLILHTPISGVPSNVRNEVTAVRTYFKAVYGRYGQDLRMEGTKNYFPLVLDTQGKWVAEGAKERIIQIFLAEDRRVNNNPTMTEVEAEQLWQEIASHDGQVDPGVDVDAFVTSSFRSKYRRVFTPELSRALAAYYVDDINALTIGYTDALAKRLAWQRQYGGYAFDAYGRPIMEMGVGGELRHKWHPTAKLEFQLNYAVRSVVDPLTVRQANWIRFKALEAYKGSLGADMNPTVRKVQGGVLTGLNTSLLSGASLTSLPDLAGIYIRLGETDGFKRSWKGLQDTMRYLKDPKYAEEAKSYASMLLTIYDGMVDHTLASSMEIGYMPTGLKRINDKFFRAIGLKRWTDFTRIAAVQVAKDDIKYLAKQNDAKSAEKLARLGLTKELVQDWVGAGLDQNTIDPSRVGEISIEVRTAINRWVDEAIMRPNAQTRPYYGSDHRMALFFYLRGFMWSFYETIWHQTMVNMDDAKGVAKVLPLMVLGATVMPLAAVGYELRKLLFGKLPAEALDLKDTTREYHGLDYLSEVARRSGLYGPLQLIDDASTDMERGNRALANFMGVPFGILVKMLDKPEDVWKYTPVLNQSSTLKAAIGS